MADSILAQPTPGRNPVHKPVEASGSGQGRSKNAGVYSASPFLYQRLISYSSVLLVFLLAVGAFVLSYATLWDTALTYGLPPRLAWIWPLLVDFALVVFSLAVVRASLYGERTWWPWLMVALYTVATVAFNILHAPHNLTAQVVAVVAPLSLFLSFETLMAILKGEFKRKQTVQAVNELQTVWQGWQQRLTRHETDLGVQFEQWQAEVERLSQSLAQLNQQLQDKGDHLNELESRLELVQPVLGSGSSKPLAAQAEPQASVDAIQTRRQQVRDLAAQGLSQVMIAERLRVSLSTVKRDLVALQEDPGHEPSFIAPAEPALKLNGKMSWPERGEL